MTPIQALREQHRELIEAANYAGSIEDYATAGRLYREYLAHVPDDPKVLFNLGALHQRAIHDEKDLSRLHALCAEAMEFYGAAIDSPHPDAETKADSLNNIGLIMVRLGHPEKAKISFHLALQLNPELRAARLNFADILVFEGQYDAADREFFEVINSDPNSAGAQFSRSMILLLAGEIRRGFREYRARFKVRSFPSKLLATDKPIWEGEDLNGRTLIVTCEQGWGDAIQFVRYFREIKERWPFCRTIFSISDSMHRLLRGTIGLDECIGDHVADGFKAPEHDFHAPLLHLPDILGTTLETIPNRVPYIMPREDWLKLSSDLFNLWSSIAGPDRKIGLCWAGSPIHGKDRWRSMRPEHFQRFIDAAPYARFFSLQCGPRAHETEQLRYCVNLPKEIHDWTQTANAILEMDLVITVDTAIAHLTGALGVPCWILLPSSPDWRWMLGRSDSPWYPQARLFRQETRDDWEPVIARVCDELSKL